MAVKMHKTILLSCDSDTATHLRLMCLTSKNWPSCDTLHLRDQDNSNERYQITLMQNKHITGYETRAMCLLSLLFSWLMYFFKDRFCFIFLISSFPGRRVDMYGGDGYIAWQVLQAGVWKWQTHPRTGIRQNSSSCKYKLHISLNCSIFTVVLKTK